MQEVADEMGYQSPAKTVNSTETATVYQKSDIAVAVF